MPERMTIKQAWRDFEIDVVPLDAGTVQREEMRRAFYAGARSMFIAVTVGLDEGDDVSDADLAHMDALDAEVRAFGEEMARAAAVSRG